LKYYSAGSLGTRETQKQKELTVPLTIKNWPLKFTEESRLKLLLAAREGILLAILEQAKKLID
jgi:hypothetical protein